MSACKFVKSKVFGGSIHNFHFVFLTGLVLILYVLHWFVHFGMLPDDVSD